MPSSSSGTGRHRCLRALQCKHARVVRRRLICVYAPSSFSASSWLCADVSRGVRKGEVAGVTIPRAFVSLRWSQTLVEHPSHFYMYFTACLTGAQLTIYMIKQYIPKIYIGHLRCQHAVLSVIFYLTAVRDSDWSGQKAPVID